MKDLQTPQKQVSRSSSASSSHSKNPLKIVVKSLNATFTSASEESSSEVSPDDACLLVSPLNSELTITPTSYKSNDVVFFNSESPQCSPTPSATSGAVSGGLVVAENAKEESEQRKVLEEIVKSAVEEYQSDRRFLNLTARIVLFCLTILWLALSTLILSDLGFLDLPPGAGPPST